MLYRAVLVYTISLVLSANITRAQSIPDLITELVLDEQKLGELKDILGDMYQGYEIVDKGYTNIRNIAEGNFNLHKTFLDALLAVSPAVANYARVVEIINTEKAIIAEYKAGSQRFNADGHFTSQELSYIGNTYTALVQQSEKEIDELVMVVTADQLRMSDAERMQAIDRVYADVTGQLGFLRRFDNATSVQAIQRLRESNDIITLKSIYGIQQ